MSDKVRQPAAFERLFDTLTDPSRTERTMGYLLAGYAGAWTLYGVIAKSSQDIHADMGEMWAWAHPLAFGTPKHPPLGAWIVAAWFSVFPRSDWAFYLLSVLVATLGLWIAWRVAGLYLNPEKRVIGIALLTLVPFYNFHVLKFNANSVLIPFWAATTWWFLKSLDSRRAGWSMLTGAGSAAAFLGKYWSLVLFAGLGIAALTDVRRAAYFRLLSPWLTILAGGVLVAPNIAWLFTHHFTPVDYALQSHPTTLPATAGNAAVFIIDLAAYAAAPLLFVLIAARPGWVTIRDTLWPHDPMRRTIVVAFASPILIAVLASIVLQVLSSAIWMMPSMTLLPVVLLSSPLLTVSRKSAVRLLAFAIAFPIVMIAAAPGIAFVIHREGVKNDASHYRLIAKAVQQGWSSRIKGPLRIAGGNPELIDSVAFYLRDLPQVFNIFDPAATPWIDDGRINREGAVVVCPAEDEPCMTALAGFAKRFSVSDVDQAELARRFFGTLDRPADYKILFIPPGAERGK